MLEELDRRTVKSVKISTNFPGYEEMVSLVFQKGDSYDNYGVRLDIESTNPGWAKQCLAQLSDEVDKSVPKWSFFLSIKGRVFALVVVLAGILGVASLIEARYVPHGDLGGAVAITAVSLAGLGTPIVLLEFRYGLGCFRGLNCMVRADHPAEAADWRLSSCLLHRSLLALW